MAGRDSTRQVMLTICKSTRDMRVQTNDVETTGFLTFRAGQAGNVPRFSPDVEHNGSFKPRNLKCISASYATH